MNKFRLNINGQEVLGIPGQTILEVAKENDIFIPTLCYDERTEVYGACGLCVVEVEGNPKLVKACATEIAPSMVVKTNTERVMESRRTNLELLLSNHVGDCQAPCSLACPAGTDCQGYVGLVANGEIDKANELIKDKIPLPACIGRVCPHPCEENCRRGLIEEPISIALIKRFAGEYNLAQKEKFIPDIAEDTGKKVAIIGGGPLGLSAAYFLRQKGHSITIFESMPKAGGMLRYGIPEYRLPKQVLDAEIDIIKNMGVDIRTNTSVGQDIPFDSIRKDYDAVLIAIGAWLSTGVGCPGEDGEGVWGGIDFLRRVVRNEEINLGKRVAIVGGGNTAMDACRSAVRLGATEVYNIYRRTKAEMPADAIEIEEAEEEGVIFKNLTNPNEILLDENGKVKAIKLDIMELGEPDASGRRRPVKVEGKSETIEVDNVILAIGQAVDASVFPTEKTRKGAVAYNPDNFVTSLEGVFAGGDCGNDKISIAIESIADANKVSVIIDRYLNGEDVVYKKPYFVKRFDITEKTFEDRERMFREKAAQLSPEERKDNFNEVVYDGLLERQAIAEANRCLQCGCHDYFECKLIDYANQYDVKPDRIAGEKTITEFYDEHPFIARDPNKCILCGLCVRVCDEVMGIGALGLVNRGFDTVVMPTLGGQLCESGCDSCGQCVSVCPVGAIQEKLSIRKDTPMENLHTSTTCPYCSVGCSLDLESHGDLLVKANPEKDGVVNEGLCCSKGKWGFDCSTLEGKEDEAALYSINGKLDGKFNTYYDAFVNTIKKMESIRSRYGKDAIAISVSDRYTNEEAYVIKKLANLLGAKIFSFNNKENGLAQVIGQDISPNTINELLSTDVILTVGFIKERNPVIWNKLKQAAKAGAKVIVLDAGDELATYDFAYKRIKIENSLEILAKILKTAMDKGSQGLQAEGLLKKLKDVEPLDGELLEVINLYLDAKKAMIVYQQNVLSVEASKLIGDIAVASGHIGTPRDGILMIKAKNNSQGLVNMGIKAGAEVLKDVRGLMIFGEDPEIDFSSLGLEFLMVSDTHITKTASQADVFIPGTGFASTSGTYFNTEGRLLGVEKAINEKNELSNWEIAQEMAEILEENFGFKSTEDISKEMDDVLPLYKYTALKQIVHDYPLAHEPKLVDVDIQGKLVDELKTTDSHMNMIRSRVPKPVVM